MTEIDLAMEVRRARKLRQRVALDLLDYRRELARLAALDSTQRQLSQALGISQPSLSSALRTAKKVPPLRPGFSGADPYEVCQRHTAGDLSRAQVIDELSRWVYVIPPKLEPDYFDDPRNYTPGSFDDVARAFDDGLIDAYTYDTVLAAVADDSLWWRMMKRLSSTTDRSSSS